MKHCNILICLSLFLSVCSLEILSKDEQPSSEKTKKVKTHKLLQQNDTLNLTEFHELYPAAIDRHGNFQTEPVLYKIIHSGSGTKTVRGETVTVHYSGFLPHNNISTKTMLHQARNHHKNILVLGGKFDSSYDRGATFKFKLGVGQVIAGWDLAVSHMKIGEKRIVIIPANLAYGQRAMGKIPANSTLIFEIELIASA